MNRIFPLGKNTYQLNKNGPSTKLTNYIREGFAFKPSWFDVPASGFRAKVFKIPGGYVLAFRGTDGANPQDWKANFKQGAGYYSEQYRQAVDLTRKLLEVIPRDKLTLVGHSLGGGLASTAARIHGLDATTFNAAGVKPESLQGYRLPHLDTNPGGHIKAFRVNPEILTSVQLAPAIAEQIPAIRRQIPLPRFLWVKPPLALADEVHQLKPPGDTSLLENHEIGVARKSLGTKLSDLKKSLKFWRGYQR